MPTESVSPVPSPVTSGSRSGLAKKLAVLFVVVAVFGVAFWLFGDQLSLQKLAEREADFRSYQQRHPVLVYFVAFATYVVVAGLSLPGAAGMTLLNGWLFGMVPGVILVSFASTTGASVAFLLSRYLLRDVIQSKFGQRLQSFNEALRRKGAFYLFTLRLIPAVPFFVINVVMGLTPVRLGTYWWVSQIGMLPGTAVFVYAGSSVPDLQTLAQQGVGGILSPNVLIAFVLLGLFPLAVKKVMSLFSRPGDAKPADLSDRESPISLPFEGPIAKYYSQGHE